MSQEKTSRRTDPAPGISVPELEALLEGTPDALTYEDQALDNRVMASCALVALGAYARITGHHAASEGAACVIEDLVNDLHHLADIAGIDWNRIISDRHYDEEKLLERGQSPTRTGTAP